MLSDLVCFNTGIETHAFFKCMSSVTNLQITKIVQNLTYYLNITFSVLKIPKLSIKK